MYSKRILVIQTAGLGWDFLRSAGENDAAFVDFRPAGAVFPAVTCTAQASFRTALPPERHGMFANGFYDRALRKAFFWEQSAGLVDGERIWSLARRRGARTALLFWQQSLGEDADTIVSPAPIHRHRGGMIPACYSRPAGIYERLRAAVGAPFRLHRYWGPLASIESSRWIAAATAALLESGEAPDICLTYLPGLDYDLQRYGPGDARARAALRAVLRQLRNLTDTARRNGLEVLIFGDYAVTPCPAGPVYPNRILREAGWFATREVRGMHYADPAASRGFAVADHEIAHVYLADPGDAGRAGALLAAAPGIAEVIPRDGPRHPRAGDLTAVAADGAWMSYKWWRDPAEAPDFAAHVDIHNKPGFDPCELFLGWPPGAVSQNDRKVGGTHGKTGPGREIAWASTCPEIGGDSLTEIAAALRARLEKR